MKNFAFPKTSLLRKSKEFEQVYAQGKRLYGDGFSLIFMVNTHGYNRLGISIHRRVRGAVRRNRIKRIIRESFRLNRDLFPVDADIVLAVKPGFSLSSPVDVTEAVSLLTHSTGGMNGEKL